MVIRRADRHERGMQEKVEIIKRTRTNHITKFAFRTDSISMKY